MGNQISVLQAPHLECLWAIAGGDREPARSQSGDMVASLGAQESPLNTIAKLKMTDQLVTAGDASPEECQRNLRIHFREAPEAVVDG